MSEKKVRYPALTSITQESQVMSALNRVIETLVPLTGQHRVKENQAITWLDLATAGYKFDFSGEGDFVLEPPYQPENPDMSTPPAIVNFEGFASFNYVTFSWDQPPYRNHSHVEIWRAEGFKNTPPVPTVLDDSVFRLLSMSIVVSDTVLPADVWRYWARNVSKTGVVGPWTSVDGLLIEVPESPSYLIDKISGEIREGDLYPALGDKINVGYDGYYENTTRLDDVDSTLVAHTETLSSYGVAIQEQSEINTEQGQLINASYTVRIDAGNAVHGFGLMVDGTTGRSDFIIRSDRFAIAAPQQYDQAGRPIISTAAFPFIVDVTNPANPKVLIKNAYIDKAYIESLVTGSLIADKIVGQTITGTHIRGGDIAIGANFTVDTAGSATMQNAFIKGTMQSNNYAAGSAGWQVRNDGYAEFRNVVARGTIYADSGYFNGTVYAEKMVGGVYSQKLYTSAGSAMSGSTSFRTAFTMNVTRGMSIARAIELASDIGIANCQVQATATTPEMNAWGKGIFEVRVLRDGGSIYSAQFEVTANPAYPGPTGGSTSDTKTGLLPVRAILGVQGDSGTHTYTVQYRVVGTDASSGSVSVTPLIGVISTLTTFVGRFAGSNLLHSSALSPNQRSM